MNLIVNQTNKIRVDKGSEFYNRSMKSWLVKIAIEMYLTHNKRKSVAAERFIRTLKSNIYKHMTAVSKYVCIHKLDHNNPSKEINNKDPKLKIGDIVRISKYKNIFARGYAPDWSEEVFVITKIKNTVVSMCY